jgi:pimeloyl-ACP methyl ester carboxylesterase
MRSRANVALRVRSMQGPPIDMSTPALPTRPLWQRLLLRRLKFLAWLGGLLLIVFGGSYWLAPQWLMQANQAREAMAVHVDKQSVVAGDTTWSYYAGGEGPDIMLLHGFAADKSEWLAMAEELTPHFHVIIPDLPGWGESTRVPGADYSIEAQAARLEQFVQAIGVRGFALAGHGTGAAVATVYAAKHPDRVARLALFEAFGLQAKDNAFSTQATAAPLFEYDDRAGLARSRAMLMAQPPAERGRFADVLVRRNRADRAFVQERLAGLRQGSQQTIVQSHLAELDMPVLGLWCRDDPVIDSSALDSLRSGLSHAAAISSSMLSGCKHLPMQEKPQQTAQILTAFVLSH